MEILNTLRDTPLPTLLVGAGVLFLVLALVSQLGRYVKMPAQRQKYAAVLGGVLLVVGIGLHLAPASLPEGVQVAVVTEPPPPRALPEHARLTREAWEAFNAADYEGALRHASECVDRFERQARREQQAYSSLGNPPPPVGRVSEEEKNAILSRGGLNDVGTCHFISGEALRKLGRHAASVVAYEAALQFPAARVWDEAGEFFWAPAQSAADALAEQR